MSTLALTPEAPVSNRTRRQQGLSSPSRAARPRRMQWTPLASVAAALLVIVASFGVWQINQPPSEPPLAPQMAAITSGDDVAQVVATPDATAVVDESGNRSIPIVQHVDEQPMDGPVIWLTNAGDVMYDDGTEVTTIATEVTSVQPGMPNIIRLSSEGEETTDREGNPVTPNTLTYYNLLTGETLVDDGSFSSYLGSPDGYGPLDVGTIADAPREWSIVNFETMQSESIAELTGGQFRSSDSITVNIAANHSAVAIGTSQYESEGSAVLMQQSGLPGEVAVIPADLSGATWVAVPDTMPTVNNISLSPDGTALAFISNPFGVEGSTTTISVVDVQSGEEIVRTEPMPRTHGAFFQWIEDDTAFIVVNGTTIERHTLDGSDPTVLLEAEGSLMLMPRIGVTDVLHVMVTSADITISTPEPSTTQFLIINTATGETISIDGEPWFMGTSSPVQYSTSLAPVAVSQDGLTATLVHPITGEEYPDLVADVDDPMSRPDFESEEGVGYYSLETVRYTQAAPISIVQLADGNIAIFTTTQDSFEARLVDVPEELSGQQLYLSPDGRHLIAGNSWSMGEGDTMWVLDLSEETNEWMQLPPDTLIFFADVRED